MENKMDNEEKFEDDIETVDTTVEQDIEMSAEDDIENIEEPEVEVNPISELIGSIEDKDFVKSNDIFNNMISDRLSTALDNERIAIANRLYNNAPEAEAEEGDMEYDEAV